MADIDQEIKNLYLLAKKMRYSALEMSLNCGEATHLGGGLSIVRLWQLFMENYWMSAQIQN